jgi:TonB family protein
VRTLLLAIISLTIVLLTTSFGQEPAKQTKGRSNSSGVSTKEPVHLVVNSDAQAKQVFTYFPYPIPPNEYRFSNLATTGMYRLTIDAEGVVTQIQILKRFGVPAIDADALKTFIRWRAKPGPPRIVDVGWRITPGYQLIRRDQGHLPPRH